MTRHPRLTRRTESRAAKAAVRRYVHAARQAAPTFCSAATEEQIVRAGAALVALVAVAPGDREAVGDAATVASEFGAPRAEFTALAVVALAHLAPQIIGGPVDVIRT
ncbi:hypothetical protein OMK64_01905 [Cellulomonas fimi]|uniref:hypothetical protein n=1 Tax=Cellulomonas fimi TaxID=1708 RepID=UPI00234DC325|nr:hypothetical protein [Cellulomonas fimi]MDC7120286.1 hypothetical protein [Cellulomonas fimi]